MLFLNHVQNLHIHAVRANFHIMFSVQLYRYWFPYLFIHDRIILNCSIFRSLLTPQMADLS